MSKAKVVSLDGRPVAAPGEPDPNVVSSLEELLEGAKSGDVQGLAFAVQHYDNSISNKATGKISVKLMGCVERLKLKIDRLLDQ